MSRWEAWNLHIWTVVVAVSGIGYFWTKYLIRNEDPFALVNHPWQQPLLKIHILAAPFLVLAIGIIFQSHLVQKLKLNANGNRRSGLAALALFPLMTFSGYFLQVATDPLVLRWALILHVTTGVLYVGICIVHQVISSLIARRKERNGQGNGRLAA